MSERLVFRITPEGNLQCLWYPELDEGLIDLADLGEVQIRRASTVEPTATGEWEAILTDGTPVGRFPSRAQALAAEVRCLEERLIAGAPPFVKS